VLRRLLVPGAGTGQKCAFAWLEVEHLCVYVDKGIDWSDASAASQMMDIRIKEICSSYKHTARLDGSLRLTPDGLVHRLWMSADALGRVFLVPGAGRI